MVQHFTFPFSYSLRPGNHICCLATVLWQYHNLGVTTMKDTVAVAGPAERDALGGSRWSPRGMRGGRPEGMLLHSITRTPNFTPLPGPSPPVCPPVVAPRVPSPPESLWWRRYPSRCPPPLPHWQPSGELPRKIPRQKRRHFPHKEAFSCGEDPRHAHTRISPTPRPRVRCMETIHEILHEFPRGTFYTNTFHLQIHPSLGRPSLLGGSPSYLAGGFPLRSSGPSPTRPTPQPYSPTLVPHLGVIQYAVSHHRRKDKAPLPA